MDIVSKKISHLRHKIRKEESLLVEGRWGGAWGTWRESFTFEVLESVYTELPNRYHTSPYLVLVGKGKNEMNNTKVREVNIPYESVETLIIV